MELVRNIQFSVIENQQFGDAIVTYRTKKSFFYFLLFLCEVILWKKAKVCSKIRKLIKILHPTGLSDFQNRQITIVGGQMKSRFSIVYLTI